MSDTAQHQLMEKNIGDTAVNGLIAGILAGLGMAAYLVLSGVLSGFSPADMLGLFDPGMDGHWLKGTFAHLAVSGVYGVIFASLFLILVRIRPSLLRFGWLAGLVYGLFLFGVARGVLLPATGSSLLEISTAHLLIAHAIYGLVMGLEVSRK